MKERLAALTNDIDNECGLPDEWLDWKRGIVRDLRAILATLPDLAPSPHRMVDGYCEVCGYDGKCEPHAARTVKREAAAPAGEVDGMMQDAKDVTSALRNVSLQYEDGSCARSSLTTAALLVEVFMAKHAPATQGFDPVLVADMLERYLAVRIVAGRDHPSLLIEQQIDALTAALSQQRAVAEGWVLVPREARLSMLEAMSIALYEDVRLISARERFRAAYAALLAAAPSPEQPGNQS